MTKNQRILGIVLIVQIVLILVVFLTGRPTPVSNEPLLTNYSPENVTELSIQDAQGNQITIAKADAGWVLPEAGGFPVIGQTVETLLADIAEIRTSRLVTRTAESHDRLQVSDNEFQRKINIGLADGEEFTLYLGSAPAPSSTHVRLGSENQVFLTNAINTTQTTATAANWINTRAIEVQSEGIRQVQVRNENGVFTFTKDEAGTWQSDALPAERELDSNTWSSAVAALSNLRMVAPVGTALEDPTLMDDPAAVVEITYQDGENAEKSIVLNIGEADESGINYYAKLSTSDYFIKISAASAERWINLNAESFAADLPTQTETAAP